MKRFETISALIEATDMETVRALVRKWQRNIAKVKVEKAGRLRLTDRFGRKYYVRQKEKQDFLRFATKKLDELWEKDPLFPVLRNLGRERVEELARQWRDDPDLTVTPLASVRVSDRPTMPFLTEEEKGKLVGWIKG